jgi:segregation and condensation protein A
MDYRVDLPVFRGPLDLLLYLVKRNEVDICDIPIARIAEQFSAYLAVIQLIDVEQAGDFLVMASTLMEIKSRLVLPRGEESGEEEEDPRLELVRQLIQYKKYKDAAALLEAQAERQSYRLPRQGLPVEAGPDPAQQPLRAVELWDLVSAFGRLMRETLALQPQQIVVDQTPQHVYMEQIVQRLEQDARLPFSALFTPPYTRGRLVGLFLAVLELSRRFRVAADQPEAFGDIWLSLLPEAPEAGPAPPAGEGPPPDAPPPPATNP